MAELELLTQTSNSLLRIAYSVIAALSEDLFQFLNILTGKSL